MFGFPNNYWPTQIDIAFYTTRVHLQKAAEKILQNQIK